jgi:hypothetical protein
VGRRAAQAGRVLDLAVACAVRGAKRDGKPGRIGRTLLGAAYLLFRYRKQSRPAPAYARLQKRVRRALIPGLDREDRAAESGAGGVR